ncbi:competence/damage-inducible protein A [Mesonia maritima]|uniref:CinA-like protein n=1 Tax=Mesonia maritima TaxID=1793873 RepID=A0ABU1KAF9_9FLAO|nr:competence/damage-inducible protein A [Mesonia maritima]MDR6301472.1 nicotinamide-nucleotide amidase [Mesonia maritima]
MNAEIITIGDEILIGQIVDTNSAFIAKKLNKIGIDVAQITSIQDEESHILQSIEDAAKRSQIVILTGGLGPTNDDITKKTLCKYFQDEMVHHQEVLVHIEKLFEKLDTQISQLNRDQAMLPSKAIALHNEYGTAPGMFFDENGIVYVSLPGVPFEMKHLLEEEVIPRIQDRFERPFIVHKTVLTYGVGESTIAQKIADWENALPNFIKLAYLPGLGRVRLRLSARGNEEQKLIAAIDTQIESLQLLIGDIIRGYEDEETIEERIAKKLNQHNFTVATAESCTGGKIAARFTTFPGASSYFKGSIVTYATSAKNDVLKIPKDFIEKYSVVSAEITEEMAKRTRKLFHSDFAIATTGNAGPTKGDSDAEIGTVFIAIASKENVEVFEFNLGNQREKVTEKAVNKAFELLLNHLEKI